MRELDRVTSFRILPDMDKLIETRRKILQMCRSEYIRYCLRKEAGLLDGV